MLMFNFHIVFSLGLIALASGAAILIWSEVHDSVGTSLTKVIGYIIIIVSVLNILCVGYWAIKYEYAGYFDKPYPMMMQSPMMRGRMMGGKNMSMMQCPMMSEQMMKDQSEQNHMMPMSCQEMMKQDGQNQMMPMNGQMETKQIPDSMMQNQMKNTPTIQDTAIETQKPLSK